MELKQLKYFTHVAELGSYTRAAEIIDVAQPVLSRQIRQLEIELRQNLLIRHGRGVILTDAGKTLLEHSRIILQQLELAYEDLSLSDGKLNGHVFLGIPPTLVKLISVDVVKAFKEQLPDANLTIIEALTANLEESIHLGRIDIALLNNPTASAHIDTHLLAEEELFLICDINAPLTKNMESITLKEVAALPLITPCPPNTFRMLLEQEMLKMDLKPNIAWEIDSIGIIMKLVAEGMGYAILSRFSLTLVKQGNQFKAIPITSPTLINRLYLGISSKRIPTRLHKKMSSLLTEVCKQHFPSRENNQ